MLDGDLEFLLEFIQKQDAVIVTARDSDSPKVSAITHPQSELESMILWNQSLIATLERKLVSRPGGSDYFRVDYSLPVLELSPSRHVAWNGSQALVKGRLYGFFDKEFPGYKEWYSAIVHWIRKNFTKSPVAMYGGYIGPEALRWFNKGGVLLPMFEPPPTSEWLAAIDGQHAVDSSSEA